jgi:hypothetical protein
MNALRLALALAFSTGLLSAADFLPLQQGNSWTYRRAGTGETFRIQVGLPVFLNQHVYHLLRGYLAEPALVRIDERGSLVAVDEETGQEHVVTDFTPFEGGWWDAPARSCEIQGQTSERGTVHDGPAGPVGDVREIHYRIIGCADVGVQYEQYAANIGMLRRTSTTIAGPVTFDLVRARVGNLEINAATHSSFSVSLDRTAAGESIAQLRLESNSPVAQKLRFSTSQEFDAEILDASDQLVWRWSNGQAFTQSEHEITVSREWASSVALPTLQPGSYTVHAWVTTAGPVPQFSAAIPLIVTPEQ